MSRRLIHVANSGELPNIASARLGRYVLRTYPVRLRSTAASVECSRGRVGDERVVKIEIAAQQSKKIASADGETSVSPSQFSFVKF